MLMDKFKEPLPKILERIDYEKTEESSQVPIEDNLIFDETVLILLLIFRLIGINVFIVILE